MEQELLYLRPDVQVEPLFDSWYAWPYLIAPATAAKYLVERHLRIMDSYISAPQFHANALKDPKMVGGPFLDCGGKRVEEIKALRDRTKKERNNLIELSTALSKLERILRDDAKGLSMQPLYQKIPDLLKGYVELTYDLNNHPNYRLIEPLLYGSEYYDRSAQSFMLSLTKGDSRAFVLSTPRLEDEESFHWRIPFDHENVDQFFQLEKIPQPWPAIKKMLGICAYKESLLRSFFTTEKPKSSEPYQGTEARWRYFGHACVLIETAGTSLLLDPSASYTYPCEMPRYTYQDFPDQIDYVLITHNHQDHVLLETLIRLRHKIKRIVIPKSGRSGLQDPSLKLILKALGFKNIIELDDMETIPFAADSLFTGIPFLGEHADLNIQAKIAYLININRKSMLFAADSCVYEPRLYDHIYQKVGSVDTLFIGMECDGAPLNWLYGPLMSRRPDRDMDQSRRLNGSDCEQAMAMVNRLQSNHVHVYAMGQEPWLSHVMGLKYTSDSRPIVESNRLIEMCRERSISAERLFFSSETSLNS
ncbi:MAG TPA: MBL fold metallo-hydrolase [Burkholderiaceae bacterium]|jgi:L-ascorbate metabolism protein UlaG (beta-lactamase superfamily)